MLLLAEAPIHVGERVGVPESSLPLNAHEDSTRLDGASCLGPRPDASTHARVVSSGVDGSSATTLD